MTLRVCDCISDITTDIDLEAKWDARDADASVAKCIAAVTECLKSDAPNFTQIQRELLRPENEQPLSVNVMPLVRAQIETLYAICLIIENPEALTNYEKDGWKKLFV